MGQQDGVGRGIVDALHACLVGGQADVEVVGETEEFGGTEALGQPAPQEGRDLADLSVLQAQLALGIAAGEGKSGQGRKERLLLGQRPPPEVLVEVDQGDLEGRPVSPLEGSGSRADGMM